MDKSRWLGVLIHATLLLGGLIMLYPLIYMLLGSLMESKEYFYSTSLLPIAKQPNFNIFAEMLTFRDVPYWLRNTGLRTLWYLVWTMTTSLVLGYFFSKGRFFGKTILFYMILATMMVPAVATFVPSYLIFARWPWAGGNSIFFGGSGLLNTWGVLLLPGIVNAYFMFLVKQMYDTLPNEFEDSARVDGAGTFRIIFQIYAPMLKPVLALLVAFTFFGIWNDFLTNLVYAPNWGDRSLTTIGYGILYLPNLFSVQIVQNQAIPHFPRLFAVGFLATLPPLIIFLIFQRYIVKGLAMSGLKG